MAWSLRLFSGLVAMISLMFVGASALAQHSPIGKWEMAVTGRVAGDAIKGIAYVEFMPDGTLSGSCFVREGDSMLSIGGTWSQEGSSFFGNVSVSDVVGTFELVGKARLEKMTAKLTQESGDRLSLRGKREFELDDRDGPYTGEVRQYLSLIHI